MGHAEHIAATVGAQRVEVHGTLRHDAATVGGGSSIHRDGGRIGDAMTAGGGAQVAIDPARDTCGGRHTKGERFGATGAAVRLGQVGEVTWQAVPVGLPRVRNSLKPAPTRPSAKYHTLLTGPETGGRVGVGVGVGVVGPLFQ